MFKIFLYKNNIFFIFLIIFNVNLLNNWKHKNKILIFFFIKEHGFDAFLNMSVLSIYIKRACRCNCTIADLGVGSIILHTLLAG